MIHFEKLEGMLDPKMQQALTACFANIPDCGNVMGLGDEMKKKQKRSHSKQREAMKKMEGTVKENVAWAVSRAGGSVMTKDDATLLTEVDLMSPPSADSETDNSSASEDYSGEYSSGCESNLNTIGDETLESLENKRTATQAASHILGNNINSTNQHAGAVSPTSSTGGVRPGIYKQTIRSKFDAYRLHQQFSNAGNDPPSDKSMATAKSLQASEAIKLARLSPSSRRNELAKQIIRRRQSQPQTPSRSGVDP